MPATVQVSGQDRPCIVRDLSPGGAGLEVTSGEPLAPGTDVVLSLEPFGAIPAEVRYATSGRNGLMFHQDAAGEARMARLLLSLKPARSPERRPLATEATITAGGRQMPCFVESISEGGAGILFDEAGGLVKDEEVALNLEGHGDVAATVRHVDGRKVGLMFRQTLDLDPAGP